MTAAWIALLLAALVLLLAAVWLGSLVYWANQHGPEQRTLYRYIVSSHALNHRERRQVQEAMDQGVAVENPQLRVAVVDWARRAVARDVELRTRHPLGSIAVVGLYVAAGGCAVAAIVVLLLDGRTSWANRLSYTFNAGWVTLFAARPFRKRRNWRRAIERNGERAPAAE